MTSSYRAAGWGATALGLVLVGLLSMRWAGLAPLASLLDPADGLWRTARTEARAPARTTLRLPALQQPVTVVRDARWVPHIYAASDRDAIITLGYLIARDRLFQLDFIPRVAAGRLAAALGPSAVRTDRFLRSTGMDWGARRNLQRIKANGGRAWDVLQWYSAGVNAHLKALPPDDLPFMFRLFGYRPAPFRPLQSMRLLQYMAFNLTYGTDDAAYGVLQRRMDSTSRARLYPHEPAGLYVPIIPPAQQLAGPAATGAAPTAAVAAARAALARHVRTQRGLRGGVAEGFVPGKGSNNWAVSAARSTTGAPLLANDMHLQLTLPPIWYEAHLVTPTMNVYGLTVPGAPLPIQGITPTTAWGFTNTGADVIDHYALTLDSTGTRYRYNGTWRPLRTVYDTIRVNGGAPVPDTLRYAHWGPVIEPPDSMQAGAVALQWTAHKRSRTLQALWGMLHADSLAAFQEALRFWDTPMQNILYAGRDGHIAIRSTGYVPTRRAGHGRGLLDGSTDRFAWTGRIPFDDLPYARDPAQGFLTSSNQKPTGPNYPHYLNHDWRDGWRSLRLDTLLHRTPHSPADLMRFQADVDVQQRDVWVPLLRPLTGLSARADTLRQLFARWDGTAARDRPEPLAFYVFTRQLHALAWDEPVFALAPDPEVAPFVDLIRQQPSSRWFDIQSTPAPETAPDLLRAALEATADTLAARYGWTPRRWRWGDHHAVVFKHLSQTDALQALWRGPFSYPGFASTVSPARDTLTTHSASQRLVVDFSTTPPTAHGLVPGGQSGHPLSAHYGTSLTPYVNFDYVRLDLAATPAGLPDSLVRQRATLRPSP
ncbi:penicillin acylase family protein [Salisaeta longa]|uniref:penicillin acylase family protein n=1 Tax=Salisaeta longa TaxID=503170 RepID=UPI0003B38DAD|nr:penicillin acylase family protein [Salisaeta longa]